MTKWGIISTARINETFLAGAREAEAVEIIAVASRDRAAAERYAREHEIERGYGGYDALLSDPDVEVVYISLPNGLHFEWVRRALQAGKHVLCEKPLSRRAHEVEALFAAARERGLVVSEAFMYRHHPLTLRAAELVSDGAIGRLRLVRSSFSFALADAADPRLEPRLDGGALMDVGCYCVNASRLLAGEPERVSGESLLGGRGVDIVFAGTMRCADGVIAQFDCGLALAQRQHLEVVGDAGRLLLADPWHCVEPIIELEAGGARELIEAERVNPYRLEAEDVSAAVRGEHPPRLGRADAVGQARAIESLYRAADTAGVLNTGGAQ